VHFVKDTPPLSTLSGVIRNKNIFLMAPYEDLHPVVSYYYYWGLGLDDKKLVDHALDHFDQSVYGLR
jgi:hypothetical protein